MQLFHSAESAEKKLIFAIFVSHSLKILNVHLNCYSWDVNAAVY